MGNPSHPLPSHPRWEYRHIECLFDHCEAVLAEYGKDGWELVSVQGCNFFLKRLLGEERPPLKELAAKPKLAIGDRDPLELLREVCEDRGLGEPTVTRKRLSDGLYEVSVAVILQRSAEGVEEQWAMAKGIHPARLIAQDRACRKILCGNFDAVP